MITTLASANIWHALPRNPQGLAILCTRRNGYLDRAVHSWNYYPVAVHSLNGADFQFIDEIILLAAERRVWFHLQNDVEIAWRPRTLARVSLTSEADLGTRVYTRRDSYAQSAITFDPPVTVTSSTWINDHRTRAKAV